MRQPITLEIAFVKSIPEHMDERTLYVSMDYATVAHKCCCGCGKEVVTPLSPTDWKLTYNGVGISLFPSIGNWSFDCQSHYWIDKSAVRWAEQWDSERIEAGRAYDRRAKSEHYGTDRALPRERGATATGRAARGNMLGHLSAWISNWWSR